MKGSWVTLFWIGLTWASVNTAEAQGYDQSVMDLLNGAKARQGTPAEEAALQGQLEGRVDPLADASSDQKVVITAQDKANNPYYSLITSSKTDLKTCRIDRSFELYTGQQLRQIQGDFWLKGIQFRDDLRRCTVKRSYQPYQVTIPAPAKVTRVVKHWRWYEIHGRDRRHAMNTYDIQGWDDAGNLCHHQKRYHDYINTIPRVLQQTNSCQDRMGQGITCPGGSLTRTTTGAGNSYTNNRTTTWTCIQPQNRQETRLKEVITNRCASMPSSCTMLEDPADGGGCRVIGGVKVCPPWWNRNRLYSCHDNFECSTFPTSNEQCGAWFAPNLGACQRTLHKGVEAMALRKFRHITGRLRCTSFLVSPAGGSQVIPGSSPYYNGCGIFNPKRPDRYRYQGAWSSKHTAFCQMAIQPLPGGVLAKREVLQAAPGQLRVKYLHFDYHKENVNDGCTRMVNSYRSQGVSCEFLDEQVDGKTTYKSGVPLGVTLPPICKTFRGALQNYHICRAFWHKKRTYHCQSKKVTPRLGTNRMTLNRQPPPAPAAPTDAPGFSTALGSLAVVNEVAKATTAQTSCKKPNPDGSCPPNNIRLFAGGKNRCKQWSPSLQLINYGCCKANLRQQCRGIKGPSLCQDHCSAADVTTSDLVHTDKVCQKVGTYCSNRQCVGATVNGKCIGFWQCLEKKTSYCCFGSVLGKLIQQQGRPQLGKGWGSPAQPTCGGLSLSEFTKLDFSKMDFTAFINSINPTPKGVNANTIDQQAIKKKMLSTVTGANYAAP